MADNLKHKCDNCLSYEEVAGGPDHGDYRCKCETSPAYNERTGDFGKEELSRIKNCNSRKGNKTVVITGASRGIGRAIAEEFARRRYDIALISRNQEELDSVTEDLYKLHPYGFFSGYCNGFELDIRDQEKAKERFSEIYKEYGSIDILVNNAGTNSRRTLKNLDNLTEDLAGFDEEISTNIRGAYICSYLAAGYMQKQGRGSIINISSVKGKEPTSSPGYGASKAGIIKLTRDFAKALAPSIRVNCIAPGFIDTGMTQELAEDKKIAYMKQIPQARFGTVDEVAKVAAFLASSDASYITGTVIDVNGGYLMS